MKLDHVAIESTDIDASVQWYKKMWDDAKVLYQDDTWAFLESDGAKIAFITPKQHPPHLAFRVENQEQDDFLNETFPNHGWREHRDGSSSFYVRDPSGNFVEFIKYEDTQEDKEQSS